jgi:cell division septal protein FtsQ
MWLKRRKQRPRDWSQKKYGNPLFRDRGRQKFKRHTGWLVRLFIVFVLLCLGALGWFFFFSPVFLITKLEITGNERIPTGELERKFWEQTDRSRFLLASQKNIFLFDSGKLTERLHNDYILNRLEIKKQLLHKATIKLEEKPFNLIWHEGGEYYWINTDGTIILNNFTLDGMPGGLPLIENRGDWTAGEKNIAGQNEKINFVLVLAEDITSVQPKITPEKYLLSSGEDPTVTLVASNTPTIDFTIKDTPEKQLNRLIILLKTTLKSDFNKKRYINLKYGEKIFFE